jgi:transcriptional regulator with XRE-family HTH domain
MLALMDPDLHFHLGDAFRKARETRGWRVIDLAEKAGVSAGAVTNVERNKGALESQHKIAAALELTMADLESIVTARPDAETFARDQRVTDLLSALQTVVGHLGRAPTTDEDEPPDRKRRPGTRR